MHMQRLVLPGVLLLTTVLGAAEFPVDPGSTLTIDGVLSVQLAGTVIGDWDEETNPDGTQTRPGLWGGSGNQPIDLEMTFNQPLSLNGGIDGSMRFELGEVPETCTLDDVSWTVDTSGSSGAVSVTLLYETFRSINPDSLYPGGIPIELPLGETQITEARFEQELPGGGTAFENPEDPGVYNVSVTAPGTLFLTLDTLGTPTPLVLPLTLLLEGTYDNSTGGASLHLTSLLQSEDQSDLPDTPIPTIPFELPTIIPAGDFAGVLLDLTPQTATWSLTLAIDVWGHAETQNAPGDVNGDGVVDTNDILAILSAWGQCKACPEDLNGDGMVGVDDILLVIAHWS